MQYLNHNQVLSIYGWSAYCIALNQVKRHVNAEEPIRFSLNPPIKSLNAYHNTGSPEIVIKKDGIYKLYYTDSSDQPLQVAITINGVVYPNSIAGINNGAGAINTRTIVPLRCGDILKVINHTSSAGTITLNENAGGTRIGINSNFAAFRLDNIPCVPPPKDKKI